MKDKLKFYINGQWVESESNEKIEVINPAYCWTCNSRNKRGY